MSDRERTALVAVSRWGCRLALDLQRHLPEAELFLPEGFASDEGDLNHPVGGSSGVTTWNGPLRELFARLFTRYSRLVFFGSVGIAVRMVAPLIRDKHSDPAVVVVDDAGRFVVSVLSGHVGGANALAARVAESIGAQAVITTASDVLDTIAVDLIGREFNWRIEHAENVTGASMALVNGETVGLLQESGELGWWPQVSPPNLVRFSTLDELARSQPKAALIITDQLLADWEDLLPPTVIYRPRSLVVGIGCRKGSMPEEIAAAIKLAVEGRGLALACVRNLATLDIKRNERGLRELAACWGIPIEYFSAAELRGVCAPPNPSATVLRRVGTPAVCEAAALLSSGAERLVVPKLKMRNVTVAVARVEFSST